MKNVFITTTDTVMGMGIPICFDSKVIFDLKQREPSKSLIIAIGSIEQARGFKEWNDKAEELAKDVWPGATTLVLSEDLALRIPDNKELRDLLIKKGPCYLTSANISGLEPTYTIEQAKKMFPEVSEFHDFGPMPNKPSKIIDVNTGKKLR